MSEQKRKKIGKRLRDLREQHELAQSDVAKLFRVTDGAISSHELGIRIPSDDLKIRYAKLYKCTVEEIFFKGMY